MKLVIATPTIDTKVSAYHHASVIKLVHTFKAELLYPPLFMSHNLIKTRSKQVKMFLDIKEATHLLMLDSDISCEPATIQALVNSGHDCVGAPYAQRNDSRAMVPDRLDLDPYVDPEIGFVESKYLGMGCTLLSRTMLEIMIDTYKAELSSPKERDLVLLFHCFLDISEDRSFCKRWRDAGGKIFLSTKPPYPIHHGVSSFTLPRYFS